MSTLSPSLPPTLPHTSPVANGLALKRDPLAFFSRLAGETGNFARYELTNGTVFLVNDPALVREVLIAQEENFAKWAFNKSFTAVFGSGLIGSEDELHQQMHRIIRPAFTQARLRGYAATILRMTDEQQRNWPEGEIDLAYEMAELTLEIIGQVLFSTSLRSCAGAIIESNRTLQELSFRTGTSAIDDRMFDDANEKVTHLAQGLIEAHSPGKEDLMGELLDAQAKSGGQIAIEQIIQEVRTLVLAGHITTANAIACAFWLLSRDSVAEQRLHDEIADVLGERTLDINDLPSLKLCEMILLEALRLYPPVWVLGREALVEVELGGYAMPKGAKLVICPWLLHRDAQTFPEPHRFYPERWRDDFRSSLARGAFIPFSIGPRSCIGERFALMEGMFILTGLAQRWRFQQLPEPRDPRWTADVIYWPRAGIHLLARKRARH